MQMQAAQMRQMTQTPIEESAAYLQGMARGEARYNHINRDRIAQQQRQVQTTRQLDILNKQTWQADQARAKMTTLEKVQLGFDIAGMTEIPGVSQIAELGSAGISLYNGDYVGAGLGVASMIPIAGKWAESAKMQRLTERVQGYSDVEPVKQLLPNEGNVAPYNVLIKAGTKGDNITPHHIPSDNHMAQYGVRKGDGIAINMEQPYPGVGGRHRQTLTYGTTADVGMTARDALAAGIMDARRIYMKDGLYDSYIRNQLQELVQQNKAAHPLIFRKN